jgi:RNA polymerase sigma factor (TIGR02999 family)
MEILSGFAETPLALAEPPQSGPNSRQILDRQFSVIYKELRRLAASVKRADAYATIGTSTLLHEAWMKLAGSAVAAPQSEQHFKRTAARVMRHIVIDAARRRRAYKRGGGGLAMFVTLDSSVNVPLSCNDDLLRLDAALDALARISPRQAELVVFRFFGGYDVTESSALLGISESTALRDWRVARAWLAAEIRKDS